MAVEYRITNKTTNFKVLDGYVGKKIALKSASIPQETVMPKEAVVEPVAPVVAVQPEQPVPTLFNPVQKAEVVIGNEPAPATSMPEPMPLAPETITQPEPAPQIDGMPVFDNQPVVVPVPADNIGIEQPVTELVPTPESFPQAPEEILGPVAETNQMVSTPEALGTISEPQPSTEMMMPPLDTTLDVSAEYSKEQEMLEALLSVRESLDMTRDYVEGLINKYSNTNEDIMRKAA